MGSKRRRTIGVDAAKDLADARAGAVDEVERHYLSQLLAQCDGRVDRTAAAAGISTRQLRKLLHKHGLRKEDFKRDKRRRNGSAAANSQARE